MKSIGIDIAVNGATIVEVSSDRNGFEILRGDYFVLDPNDQSNWEIDLLQGLKRFTEQFDMNANTVCVGLNQDLISTRNLNFPFTRRMDIHKNLLFELDEELPFSSDESYYDFKTVSLAQGSTSILAFATPQDEVHQLLTLLERVGIDPDYISVEGSAFANLFEDWNNGSFLTSAPETIPSPLHMRIFFRHNSTLVTLMHDRQMVWTRSISWGERNLILNLMKSFNYPYDQAASLIPEHTQLLLTLADAEPGAAKMSGVVEQSLNEVLRQIRLMTIDIQDKFPNGIGSATVLGPIGQIENINAYFTKALGITCNPESLTVDVFNPRQIEVVSHFIDKAAVAIGYALEGLKRPRNPGLNLRQGESAKRNQFWEKTWSKWGHAITLAAIAYVCYTIYGFARESIAVNLDDVAYTELQRHAGTIAGLRGAQASPDRIERYLREEEEKAKNAKLFEKVQDIEPAMRIVNLISSEVPSNKLNSYEIRRVDVKNSQIIIEGEARERRTVDLLRTKLQSMANEKGVQNSPPTFSGAKGVAFGFKFSAKETL